MGVRDQRLIDEYREDVVTCELARWLNCCGRGLASEIHHIVGGPFRDDVKTNIILLCRSAHVWVQESQVVAGRIVCLHAKMRTGQLDWGWFQDRGCGCQWAWIERKWAERTKPVNFFGRMLTADVERCVRELADDFRRRGKAGA